MVNNFFVIPKEYEIREYQSRAIEKFLENNGKCLFAMATGTGKTLTALFAVSKLCEIQEINSVLIIVPLKDLVEQWEGDVKNFYSGEVILIYSDYKDWKNQIQNYGQADTCCKKRDSQNRDNHDLCFVLQKLANDFGCARFENCRYSCG